MASDPALLPTGTITFLFTDIEGSTRLAQRLDTAVYRDLIAAHHRLLRAAFAPHGGAERGTQGDAFLVVFRDAPSALAAAVDAQRALSAADWPSGIALRVRMGLHSGQGIAGGDDYVGIDINRAARIAGAAHGGQIVISEATRVLSERALPPGTGIRDLGGHRLKDLVAPEHLYQVDIDGLPTAFPALRGADRRHGNLPERLTSFLGREADMDRLAALLADNRLVTLTGAGGTGKTSLAVELARRVSTAYPDGAWFVDLAAVHEPKATLAMIARTLGLSDGTEGPAASRLAAFLADRTVLLVLDNLEQLLDAAPDIGVLIRAAPDVKIVATSRAPLRVAGEQEVPIAPLPVASDADVTSGEPLASAERLFIDRARAVRPGLQLDAAALRLVAEICALLDGLPLGIELAAARVAALPLLAIRDRLAARLPLPGQAPRDLPMRQRTLEDAIDWSVALLEPAARRVFLRTAVFDGGFDLEQAETICGSPDEPALDVLGTVIALVEQSLLVPVPTAAGSMRYRALETTRAFAAAALRESGEEAATRERHAFAYLALAERAAPMMPGRDQARWLDRLAADDANLRAAILWAIDAPRPDIALRLAAALWRYWTLDGRIHEGRALIEAAFLTPGADAPTPERLAALDAAGGVAYWQAESDTALARYEEQLALARQLDDRAGEANAAFNLSHAMFALGDMGPSAEMTALARHLFVELGDDWHQGRLRWGEATTISREGRVQEARDAFRACLQQFIATGDTWYEGLAYGSLAWTALQTGDASEALGWALSALHISQRMRDRADVTLALLSGAIILERLGRPRDAALIVGAFEALCELHGVRPPAGLEMLMGRMGHPAAATRAALGEAGFADAMAEGARMTGDEAVALLERVAAELGIRPAGRDLQ